MTKSIKILLVVLTTMFSGVTPETGLAKDSTYSIFLDRSNPFYPIPKDPDVLTAFGKASKKALPARRMNILVWNVYKGIESAFRHEFLSLAQDRDLVIAQEIYLDADMLDVFRSLPHFYYSTATSFYAGKEDIRTGVGTMGTVAPVFTKFIRTQRLEPITNSPKVALVTSYPIAHTTKKLTVVNLHSINFVTTGSFRHELHRIYEVIKNIPSPLVFTGDFNTWSRERKNILLEYCQKLKLSEAKFQPDHRITFNGHPLDHFLHTSDIKVLNARVDQFYQGSDHKPLQVEIEYLNPSITQEELDQIAPE